MIWDRRFIGLAEHVSTWSKDPSTKCGAVIVRPDKTIASLGFNGFPTKIVDVEEYLDAREVKYERVIHAEMNAILFMREPLLGFTMYVWPMLSCHRCAVHIIQAGITSVIAPHSPNPRWEDSMEITRGLLREANVNFREISANDTD